jgi:hypothetical protein
MPQKSRLKLSKYGILVNKTSSLWQIASVSDIAEALPPAFRSVFALGEKTYAIARAIANGAKPELRLSWREAEAGVTPWGGQVSDEGYGPVYLTPNRAGSLPYAGGSSASTEFIGMGRITSGPLAGIPFSRMDIREVAPIPRLSQSAESPEVSYFRNYLSTPDIWVVDASRIIGDTSCKYNAHSKVLRCTVNPHGPCEGCDHFEALDPC